MAKIKINCLKCGKEIKINFMDARAVCKKCQRTMRVFNKKTTVNFDF